MAIAPKFHYSRNVLKLQVFFLQVITEQSYIYICWMHSTNLQNPRDLIWIDGSIKLFLFKKQYFHLYLLSYTDGWI